MAIDNVKIQNELNAALATQLKNQAKITSQLKDQLALATAIKNLDSELDLDEQVKYVREFRDALDGAKDSVESLESKNTKASKQIAQSMRENASVTEIVKDKFSTLAKTFPVGAAAVGGALSGIASGFSSMIALGRGAVNAATGFAGAVFEIGKSLIALPFKLLGGLVDMANSMPGGTAWAQAREDIRKDFGSFSEDISRNIKGTYKELRGELSTTGLSVYRILGNMAERLKSVHELAVGMGAAFHGFGQEVVGNAKAIIAYQRGLGITNEQMKFIGQTAKAQGRTMTDVLNEITTASTGMADRFGMSQKVISKDIVTMTEDVAHFGSMTIHEMSRAAVYTRALGLEIKDIIGTIDKYDNFEDAAQGAAHLAQAFGANVDALEMMKEQDPSKRVDMLRKSMALAGVDAAKLSRQELKLLASQTGLTEEAARQAFALKNQGLSMAEIERQQSKNQKKTLTQEEAMSKLADSIERMIKSGSMGGGFFTRFFKGFERGIKWSHEFRGLMHNIRHALRQTFYAGRAVGQMFVKEFPGVQKMIGSLSEFFSPKKFGPMLTNIVRQFRTFFTNLTTNPSTALPLLFEKLKTSFFDFFNSSSPQGSKLLSGFKTFGMALSHIFAGMLKMAMKGMSDVFKFITDVIIDPSKLTNTVKSAADSAKNPIIAMLQPIFAAVKDNWGPLSDAFMKMVNAALDPNNLKGLKASLKSIATKIVPSIFASIFGPAVIQGAISAAGVEIMKGMGKWLFGSKGKSSIIDGADNVAKFASKVMAKRGVKIASNLVKAAGPAALVASVGMGVSEGLDRFMDVVDPSMNNVDKKMAAAGAGIISSFTMGLLPEGLENAIARGLGKVVSSIMSTAEDMFGEMFVGQARKMFDPLIDEFDAIGDFITAFISGDSGKVSAAIKQFNEKTSELLIEGFKFVTFHLGPAVVKGIYSIGKSIQDSLWAALEGAGSVVMDWLDGMFSTDTFSGSIAGGIRDALRAAGSQIKQFFTKDIGNIFTSFGTAVKNYLSGKSLKDTFTTWWKDFVDSMPSLADGVGAALTSAFMKLNPEVLIKKFKESLTSLGDPSSWFKSDSAATGSDESSMLDKLMGGSSTQSGKITPAAHKAIVEKMKAKQAQFDAVMAPIRAKLDADTAAKAEAERMKTGGMSFEDMSIYKTVKSLDRKQVEAAIAKFKDIIPLFVGTGGLMPMIRDMASKISDSDELDIGRVGIMAGFSDRISGMVRSFASITALKVGDADREGMKITFQNLENLMSSAKSGAISLATVVTPDFIAATAVAQSNITTVSNAIVEIVSRANEMNTTLKNLKPINVNTKLKNLAKVVGVKNEKLVITNDKVNITVNLDVSLDAESLAYAIDQQKWFARGSSERRPKKR